MSRLFLASKEALDAETTRALLAESLLAPLTSPNFTGIPAINGVPLGGIVDGGNATSSVGATINGGSAA